MQIDFHFAATYAIARVSALPAESARVRWQVGEAQPLAGVRAWIVDDDNTGRHILQRQLQDWGMETRETGFPHEALEWAQRGDACDLAVLDFHMPGMNDAANALRILIAEDNPVNAFLLRILLERMGYDSEVAVNGVEAIEALRRDAFDVVFMDVQMPVMDGIEAARQIHKEWAPGRRPRIIALTAGVTADEIQTCKIAGMDDFLAKPIDVERLAATLAACRRLDAADDL